MEADPGTKPIKKTKKNDEKSKNKIIGYKPISSQLFPTVWLRRPFRVNNEMDRFLLDNGYNFLFYIGCFFWLVFLLLTD